MAVDLPRPAALQSAADTPLFYRPELQQLARQNNLKQLVDAIHASDALNHCPECWQWVTGPSYLSRHAVKAHANVANHQTAVRDWARARGRALRPCQWCREWYQARPHQHALTCPVLWLCGHFLARFSSLADPKQAPGSHGGARPIRQLHAEGPKPPELPCAAASLEQREALHSGKGNLEPRETTDPKLATASAHDPHPRGDDQAAQASPGARANPATSHRQPRQKQQPGGSSGYGNRGQWNKPQWPVQKAGRRGGDWHQEADADPEALKEVIRNLTRLVVRLEDAVAINNLDQDFVIFLQTEAAGNQWAITSALYQTAQEWKQKREANPPTVTSPLRNVLFFCLWASLREMLTKMESTEHRDTFEKAREYGLTANDTYTVELASAAIPANSFVEC
eukprot:s6395_g4.t1